MKKIVWIFVFGLVCVLLTGCGDKNVDEVTYNDSVDVEEEKMPEVMPIEDEIVNESQNYDDEIIDIDDEYIEMIQEKLNNRPRKKLGFLTPYEYFFSTFAKINV